MDIGRMNEWVGKANNDILISDLDTASNTLDALHYSLSQHLYNINNLPQVQQDLLKADLAATHENLRTCLDSLKEYETNQTMLVYDALQKNPSKASKISAKAFEKNAALEGMYEKINSILSGIQPHLPQTNPYL